MNTPARFRFAAAWLDEGWRSDVVIEVNGDGNIDSIRAGDRETQAAAISGAAIPGMPNVHSHAFQRAMAGLAERRAGSSDSFWTWRETMYGLAQRMTPVLLNAVAAQLYVEMLKAGYTAVCEFHYLHHQPDGRSYAERGAMSHALLDAASTTGIGLTLLPALYCTSDFGALPPTERQRQFVNDVPAFLQLRAALKGNAGQVSIGAAIHSLRAVPPDPLADLLAALDDRSVLHIHIAEQEREVEECLRHTGQRPIEWLLDHARVDERWCLVHATHATDAELAAIGRTGAVAALCPTTEANLGDGMFALERFLGDGGTIAIGSDSHICVSAVEELRWLEYQARLLRRERNVFADPLGGSTGARLWRLAAEGGARACGRNVGALRVGHRADILVLDLDTPMLAGRSGDAILDTLIFSGQPNPIRDVMVGGRWLVQEGRHFAETAIASGYRRAVATLSGAGF